MEEQKSSGIHIPYKQDLVRTDKDESDFGNYENGDIGLWAATRQLQRARAALEIYFGDKPTPEQVIQYSNVIAIKDIHSFFAQLQDDEVFSIERKNNYVNSKGEHKTIYQNIGLAAILEKLRDQQL